MDIKKILKNKKVLISLVVVILIIIFIIFAFNNRNDDMENAGISKVKYRTYTKTSNWTKWQKNGLASGDLKNSITNVEISSKKDIYNVQYYFDNNWSDSNDNNKEIKGIRILNAASFLKNYDVCYRTYNKKDKWLNWTCNGSISGNINENITAIEIKTIPKKIIKSDYLKDYIENNNESNMGF